MINRARASTSGNKRADVTNQLARSRFTTLDITIPDEFSQRVVIAFLPPHAPRRFLSLSLSPASLRSASFSTHLWPNFAKLG